MILITLEFIEPVMKTYALHLYCQQVGFCSGSYAFEDEMQEHSIGINLFDVRVRKYVSISSRQEYLGRGCICTLDGENQSGTESCSQSFGKENAIFTVYILLGAREPYRTCPIKFLGEIHYGSERKACT